jgi:hypothetical protein
VCIHTCICIYAYI